MASKRILITLAHPDDETFGLGGLILKYVSEGAEVHYVCGTKGDKGMVNPEYLERHGSIEAVRDHELNCASEILGFTQVIKLGYSDSGMVGTLDNDNPECLIQADETEVARQIVKAIREIKPQVVITFDPYGAYGHPDHIFMHHATNKAFEAAADGEQFPDLGEPYQPQKLYYTNISRVMLRIGIWVNRLRFNNPRKIGRNKDIDMVAILDHVPPPHIKIDVRQWMDEWDRANLCHASQGGGRAIIVPNWIRNLLFSKQTLTLAIPKPEANHKMEHDLFENVTL